MYQWLFRLHRHFPVQAAAVLSALPLAGCLALLFWIGGDGRYAIGYPLDVATANGNEQVVIELGSPLPLWLKGENNGRLVLMESGLYLDSGAADAIWLFVQGAPQPGGEFSLLKAEAVAAIPNPGGINLTLRALGRAAEVPLAAIALGCALVMAGPFLMRLTIAILSALLMGTAIWHGLHAAAFQQAVNLPDHAIGLLSVFALAAGLLIGHRAQGGVLHGLLERLLLISLAAGWMPALAARLGVPVDLAQAGLVLLTLLSAWFGYALLGAHWISAGLNASQPVSYAVLLVALFILVAINATSIPRAPLPVWFSRFVDAGTGRIPLHRILATRGKPHEND